MALVARSILVKHLDSERVFFELLEMSPHGFEERNPDHATVEYILYGQESELPSTQALSTRLGRNVVVSSLKVKDNWQDEWKRFHRPTDISGKHRKIRIRPPWEEKIQQPDDAAAPIDVIIDPGQAFGTGAHETTRLCIELLLDIEPQGSLADWGCGSGVIAITAAKLGFSPILACDFDPLALEALKANGQANEITETQAQQIDLTKSPGPSADIVTANLTRPLLVEVAQNLSEIPKIMILSGILNDEIDEVAASFTSIGLRELQRRKRGNWSALLLERQQ